MSSEEEDFDVKNGNWEYTDYIMAHPNTDEVINVEIIMKEQTKISV